MDHLSQLENESIYIIREAFRQFKSTALLWSIGKDSTTLLWLCRKAFFGKLPFPALHIYPDELSCAMCDKDRKIGTEFGLKAVLSSLKDIVKQIEECHCDSLELFNHGCRCGNE